MSEPAKGISTFENLSTSPSIREATAVEYFAGIGLIRMGLEDAGWRVVFANDNSAGKFEMYEEFFSEDSSHYATENVFDLDVAEIPTAALATCSFPCIDLSLAGNMNGMEGKHSSAFWGFTSILKRQGESSPHLLLIENVMGWLTSNKGRDFRVTIKALNELGYICDVFVLDALRFTPQSRPRVFVVAVKGSDHADEAKRIDMRSDALSTARLKKVVKMNSDLRWGFLDIPEPPELLKEGLTRIVEDIPRGDLRWWDRDKVQHHLSMMADSHRERVDRLAEHNFVSYRTFYRRVRNGQQKTEVRRDDIAGCLRTAQGGSSVQFVLKAGQGRVDMRSMTPREYSRLQGVPDAYTISVGDRQALNGFGDAVCVPAIAWIGKNVLNPLNGGTIKRI